MTQKILIIDDNLDDLMIAETYLKTLGFSGIITAKNGTLGVEKVKSEKPDLVITDTNMPGIDGFETCRQIRELCGSENPKIIIITGNIDAVDAVKAREVGADDYCAKASDGVPLLETVKNLLNMT